MVRPWKAPSKVMIAWRSGWPRWKWKRRAILIAHSSASAPELQKNTVSAKDCATSRSASCSCDLDAVEVGAVPELLALLLEARHQMRVGVAEQRHRDAAAEVQVASALAIEQVRAFAALEADRGALVDRQDRRDGGVGHCSVHQCLGETANLVAGRRPVNDRLGGAGRVRHPASALRRRPRAIRRCARSHKAMSKIDQQHGGHAEPDPPSAWPVKP